MARDYSHLTREQLEEHLHAAEDVCVLYGWSPSRAGRPDATDYEKAAHELWTRWDDLVGPGATAPGLNRHLTDDLIAELAHHRDETRAATLRRIRDDRTDAAHADPADLPWYADHGNLITLTAHLADLGASAHDIAYAVEKPHKHEDEFRAALKEAAE